MSDPHPVLDDAELTLLDACGRAANVLSASHGSTGARTALPATLERVGVAHHARPLSDAIVRPIDEREAAFIAAGSRGSPACHELLVGSVAMALLHHALRPVVVVPPAKRLKR